MQEHLLQHECVLFEDERPSMTATTNMALLFQVSVLLLAASLPANNAAMAAQYAPAPPAAATCMALGGLGILGLWDKNRTAPYRMSRLKTAAGPACAHRDGQRPGGQPRSALQCPGWQVGVRCEVWGWAGEAATKPEEHQSRDPLASRGGAGGVLRV